MLTNSINKSIYHQLTISKLTDLSKVYNFKINTPIEKMKGIFISGTQLLLV